MFRSGISVDTLAQESELTFAAIEKPLTAIELFQAARDSIAKTFYFMTEIGGLEIRADARNVASPTPGIPTNRNAVPCASTETVHRSK